MTAMTAAEAELEHVRAQYGRAMDTVRTMTAEIDTLQGKLYAAQARIAELEAWKAAVPMMAIEICISPEYENTYKVVQKWLAENGLGKLDNLRSAVKA